MKTKPSPGRSRVRAALPLLLVSALSLQPIAGAPVPHAFADFLGEVHAGGKYSLPTRSPAGDYLNEGGDRIADLGGHTIKLWLTPNPTQSYPDFSGSHPWPTTPSSLKTLLQTDYFQEMLNRADFTTYVFVASEFVPKQSGSGYVTTTWKDGLSSTEEAATTAQFAEVTEWLLETYEGTGKTFIFQNWEGDNALNLEDLSSTDQATAIAGMIDWLDARQAGVDQGRTAAGSVSGVAVYNAAEINYNPGTSSTFPVADSLCMVNAVVPYLSCDLYSWSNWASKSPGNEINVIRGLDYLKSHAPASSAFGNDNIYMGEFGAYESSYMGTSAPYHSVDSDEDYSALIDRQLKYAWRWGALHAVQWATYDNGLRNGVSFNPASPTLMTEDKFVGTWLVRAQASATDPLSYSFTSAYGRLSRLCGRKLWDDPLANLSLTDASSGAFSFTTSAQVWDEEDRTRMYRTTTGSTASVTYHTTEPIVDWNIRAYLIGASTAVGRIRGYTSSDGSTWSSAFDFGEVDVVVPDATNAPTARRLHLGPPSGGVPSDVRYLKIELYGASAATGSQLGSIRLVTEDRATVTDALDSLALTEDDSGNLIVSSTATSYSDGDAGRVYRNNTSPGWLLYRGTHVQAPGFNIIHYGATISGKVAMRASFDGQIWTPVALTFDAPVSTASGWYRSWAQATDVLPEGTRYLMIEILDTTASWTPQIGRVEFETTP